MKHLKGASAFAINHMSIEDGQYKWQEGYGALTLGEGSLETVMAYAAHQKVHHRDRSLIPVYEELEENI